MGFMGIIWIIILGVIAWWAWSYLKEKGDMGRPRNSALDILKERYAKGEISKEEFEEMKRNLRE